MKKNEEEKKLSISNHLKEHLYSQRRWWAMSKIMVDRVLKALLSLIGLFFRTIPLSWGLWVGRKLGHAITLLLPQVGEIVRKNLKVAFGDGIGEGDIKGLVIRNLEKLGETLVEFLRFPRLTPGDIQKYVTVEGIEHLEAALKEGRGAIIFSAHFGNWELLLASLSLMGYPTVAIAKSQRVPALNDLAIKYRHSTGVEIFTHGPSLRGAIRSLQGNKVLVMLGDQYGGPDGAMVEFFGRRVSVPKGPLLFSSRLGAPILPAFIRRIDDMHHVLTIREAFYIEEEYGSGDDGDDTLWVNRNMQGLIDIIEGEVRRYPDEWLWVYDRFPSEGED